MKKCLPIIALFLCLIMLLAACAAPAETSSPKPNLSAPPTSDDPMAAFEPYYALPGGDGSVPIPSPSPMKAEKSDLPYTYESLGVSQQGQNLEYKIDAENSYVYLQKKIVTHDDGATDHAYQFSYDKPIDQQTGKEVELSVSKLNADSLKFEKIDTLTYDKNMQLFGVLIGRDNWGLILTRKNENKTTIGVVTKSRVDGQVIKRRETVFSDVNYGIDNRYFHLNGYEIAMEEGQAPDVKQYVWVFDIETAEFIDYTMKDTDRWPADARMDTSIDLSSDGKHAILGYTVGTRMWYETWEPETGERKYFLHPDEKVDSSKLYNDRVSFDGKYFTYPLFGENSEKFGNVILPEAYATYDIDDGKYTVATDPDYDNDAAKAIPPKALQIFEDDKIVYHMPKEGYGFDQINSWIFLSEGIWIVQTYDNDDPLKNEYGIARIVK